MFDDRKDYSMEEIAKAFLGVFFTMLVAFLGVSTISASMDARNANALMAECSERIAESDYSSVVIKECQDAVAQKGDADHKWKLEIPESSKVEDSSGRVIYCKGKLTYYYSISFINMIQQHTIEVDIK